MEDCNFLLKHYEENLRLALKKGYKFMTIKEFGEEFESKKKIPEKMIVLRHDIDFDLGLSIRMASIENKHGIRSTYFVRLHAKYYSPFSADNYAILMKLIDFGHEIGLHFDFGFAKLFSEDPKKRLLKDKNIFENLIGAKVDSVSMHEPARTGTNLDGMNLEKIGIKHNAYSDIFLKNLKYISDSSARWREGCMCEFIKRDTSHIYILTHPFWW